MLQISTGVAKISPASAIQPTESITACASAASIRKGPMTTRAQKATVAAERRIGLRWNGSKTGSPPIR